MDRITLKKWFSRGKKPTEAQFAELIDSFLHKTEDRIEISNIDSLRQVLDDKAEVVHRHAATDISGLPETDNELSVVSQNPIANSVVARAMIGKANTIHTHGTADIGGLQTILGTFQSHVWRVDGKPLDSVKPDCEVTLSHTQAVVGTEVVATVTVGVGYRFDCLVVTILDNRGYATQQTITVTELNRLDGTCSFIMPFADVTVSAIFTQLSYNITAQETNGGSITVPSSAHYGSEVEIVVTPDQDYELTSISVTNDTTNENVTVVNSRDDHTFTMPASSVTIEASFGEVRQ